MKRKLIVSSIILAIIFNQILMINVSNAKSDTTSLDTKASIEKSLNLANNNDFTWSYDSSSDSWVMSIVTSVVNPVIEDEQVV